MHSGSAKVADGGFSAVLYHYQQSQTANSGVRQVECTGPIMHRVSVLNVNTLPYRTLFLSPICYTFLTCVHPEASGQAGL